MKHYAYTEALALESASDLPYNQLTNEYVIPSDILEWYARIVAYKVAHNISLGYHMNQDIDPLTYINCSENQ